MNTEKLALNIRRMTRSDIDAVLAIAEGGLTYRDMVACDPGGPLDMSFVAEDESGVIGFVLARVEYLGIPFAEVCVIHAIATKPEYRGHGVGSELVGKLRSYCDHEEVHTMRALVPQHDTELRQFIEYLGFRRSAIINYDKTPES